VYALFIGLSLSLNVFANDNYKLSKYDSDKIKVELDSFSVTTDTLLKSELDVETISEWNANINSLYKLSFDYLTEKFDLNKTEYVDLATGVVSNYIVNRFRWGMRTALHEAAHGKVAENLGHDIHYGIIGKEDKLSLGKLYIRLIKGDGGGGFTDYDDLDKKRKSRDHILIAAAGVNAESEDTRKKIKEIQDRGFIHFSESLSLILDKITVLKKRNWRSIINLSMFLSWPLCCQEELGMGYSRKLAISRTVKRKLGFTA